MSSDQDANLQSRVITDCIPVTTFFPDDTTWYNLPTDVI